MSPSDKFNLYIFMVTVGISNVNYYFIYYFAIILSTGKGKNVWI